MTNKHKYLTTIKTILANRLPFSSRVTEAYCKELNGIYQMAEEYADRIERDDIGGRLQELEDVKRKVTLYMNEDVTGYSKDDLVNDLVAMVGD